LSDEESPVTPEEHETNIHEELRAELRAVAGSDVVAPRKVQPPTSPHLILNPVWLPPAKGFAHVVVPVHGLLVFLGGQAGHRPDGTLAGESLLDQFDQACGNVVEALAVAGGKPEHIVSMQISVTDVEEYRTSLEEIGDRWRRYFDRHYPAITLVQVQALFDPGAKVELTAIAVIPEEQPEPDTP
jgi:enamine deaminase RidA (YjgF/YER057c/UK114 family)